MDDKDLKRGPPAYVPHKTFTNFINSLKESGAPSQIDRSVLKNLSGSDQSAILGSLKYLKLIDESGVPSKELLQLIDSTEEQRPAMMRAVLLQAYSFLFSGSIDLKRATTKQVEDAFREQGVSGSTIVKCIAFFLAAAKDAGIPISPHVKTPAPVRSNPAKPRTTNQATTFTENNHLQQEPPLPPDMKQIKIQLMDKPDVTINLPASFNAQDWAFLEPILKAYITRMLKEADPILK
jgi:hypothetical protein